MRETLQPENTNRIVEIGQLRCGWVSDVRWSPDGSTLAIASGNTIRLYINGVGAQPDQVLEAHHAPIKAIAFSPNGRFLASVGADLEIYLWDLTNWSIPAVTLSGHKDALNAAVFSPNGRWLAAAGAEQVIYLWDVTAGDALHTTLAGHTGEITSLTFTLDGVDLISGSRDASVRISTMAEDADGGILGRHDDWVRGLSTSPLGKMIASASKDGTVRLWDADAKATLAVIRAHEGGADCVSFSPDGRLLATGGRDHQIRIWKIAQALAKERLDLQDALITLSVHTKPVMALAFIPTGTMLASGSGDNTVRLWSVD